MQRGIFPVRGFFQLRLVKDDQFRLALAQEKPAQPPQQTKPEDAYSRQDGQTPLRGDAAQHGIEVDVFHDVTSWDDGEGTDGLARIPFCQRFALGITEYAAGDENEIDETPDEEASQCQELQYARAELADVEAVYAKAA